MIIVQVVGTADNPDVLSGTDLANIPEAGVLMIYAASTQQDTLITVTGPGSEPVTRNTPMLLRANADIRERDAASYQLPVSQGGRYVIDVNVQTAGTFRILAKYADIEDLTG